MPLTYVGASRVLFSDELFSALPANKLVSVQKIIHPIPVVVVVVVARHLLTPNCWPRYDTAGQSNPAHALRWLRQNMVRNREETFSAYAARLKPLERQYREPFSFVAPLRQHCLPAALPSTLGLSQYNPHPSS
ncbi:hypothetical protein M422DRAFT_269591 [Sphaerobolus stellatus SS14]|uniref:Uncharacterized protein n=1 Tax=Sphaerobolus stellatus (strain SS14) TaxID=990650 RepID=A0A0C9UJJ1_SPHS4|nr:hypothetical protein M422DRAFT_269591 [Sphaerobolus stellatus SS14]